MPEPQQVGLLLSVDRPPAGRAPSMTIPALDLHQHAGASVATTVTSDQCAAHLKFLAALADLRDRVANDDGLFGIVHGADATQPTAAAAKEKRWAVYTARAVERYRAWWFKCVPSHGAPPTLADLQRRQYRYIVACDEQLGFLEFRLPPLGG
jgi:hypothetical protein